MSSRSLGCGPLPTLDELLSQLQAAGFANVSHETVIPNFNVFTASCVDIASNGGQTGRALGREDRSRGTTRSAHGRVSR